MQQLAARADNTRRTTRAGMVVATSVLNAFPAAMLGDDGVLRQTLEDVAALWGWHSLALELLRFPEGHQDAVVGTKASSAAICVSSSSAYQPSLVAKFLSCGNFVAGSEMLSTYASIKPAALRAAASVFLQPITVRLSMLPEVRARHSSLCECIACAYACSASRMTSIKTPWSTCPAAFRSILVQPPSVQALHGGCCAIHNDRAPSRSVCWLTLSTLLVNWLR